MKLSLGQSQIQRLALTPQTKLYLKILQLPLADLKLSLEDTLGQNPALDELEPEEEPLSPQDTSISEEKIDFWESGDAETNFSDEEEDNLSDFKENSRKKAYLDSLITKETTLIDHLASQFSLLNLTEEEKIWTETLLGNLDENGWLSPTLSELSEEMEVRVVDLKNLLKKLQTLEPVGVFAKNLQECLLLQLKTRFDEKSELAQKLISRHFDLVQKKAFPQLARLHNVSLDKIRASFTLIQSLDPKPGKSFSSGKSLTVIPDAVISMDEQDPSHYQIEIIQRGLPKFRLNPKYQKMQKSKTLDKETKKFIREKVNEAQWLLEALENRKTTVASILKVLLEKQPQFIEKGFSALKPLRMKEVADQLSIHESTVSRAVSGKYVQTPLGTYALRSFFSGKIASGSESEESQKSVMQKIKKLIESENSAKPLSDQKITEMLSEEGIQIARRTVQKYREMMKILPTSLRRTR